MRVCVGAFHHCSVSIYLCCQLINLALLNQCVVAQSFCFRGYLRIWKYFDPYEGCRRATNLIRFPLESVLLRRIPHVLFLPKDDNPGESMSTVCSVHVGGGQVWVHARRRG